MQSAENQAWLIDKSAYVRLGSGSDGQRWADRIDGGLVRMATLTRLELGYSARTAATWRAELEVAPLAAMPIQYLTPAIEDRVVEVQLLLADRGQHRAPRMPDLDIENLVRDQAPRPAGGRGAGRLPRRRGRRAW